MCLESFFFVWLVLLRNAGETFMMNVVGAGVELERMRWEKRKLVGFMAN
jgi:hypothetical protein